ncbi:hypothetical protein ASF71_07000 [Deinococcus sp. Leaf326]|nr:hypothetical protein ASF71_07000 [Deinococcus sp. Leaf326]
MEFKPWWELLLERFRQEPTDFLSRFYAQSMKAQNVTAAEWAKGVQASMYLDTFMPSPARLVELGRDVGGFESQAREAWELAMDRSQGRSEEPLPQLARKVLNRATNGQNVSHIDFKQLPFVRKEFMAAYADELQREAVGRNANALPSGARRELTNAT